MGDRARDAREAMNERASAAKEAMNERAAAAREAAGERAAAARRQRDRPRRPRGGQRARRRRQRGDGRGDRRGQAETARRLPRVGLLRLPGLRRRPDLLRQDAEGDPRGGDLRGQPLRPARHQRPLPPGRLEAAQRAPVDAPARSLDDLLPHRRHLHAVRAAGHARHPRHRDPGRRLGRGDRRGDRRDGLDRPPEMGLGDGLPGDRLGRRRRPSRSSGTRSARPAPCCWPAAGSSIRRAPSSTRPSGPTRTRRSSATTRSSTPSSSPPPCSTSR